MQAKELEVAELRRRVARLTEEARKNEDAWKRAQAREMELLEADGLSELLNRLTGGLRDSYQLEAATLVLADRDHEIRHLLISQRTSPDALSPDVRFVDTLHGLAPQFAAAVRPWLGPFSQSGHGLLFPGRQRLGSVALLPLMRRERLVGSLNLGSADRIRFNRSLATDFLHHLGVIAAFALENTINRARLLRSGFTDVLTGWHNRRYLQARLREELARSSRERTALACLMVDVDHFKRINDEHGHLAGDEVLSQLARRVDAVVRSSDVSARYGGEEFVILLPGTDARAASILAERIRQAVSAQPFGIGAGERALGVTVSIGVAEYRPAEREEEVKVAGERLIARADDALYEAKAKGRNVVVIENNS
jgi:two-component system cell cycle response regulator